MSDSRKLEWDGEDMTHVICVERTIKEYVYIDDVKYIVKDHKFNPMTLKTELELVREDS